MASSLLGGGRKLALLVSKEAYVDNVADIAGTLWPTGHPGKRDLDFSQMHSYQAECVAMIFGSLSFFFFFLATSQKHRFSSSVFTFLGNVDKIKSPGSGSMQSGQTSGLSFTVAFKLCTCA